MSVSSVFLDSQVVSLLFSTLLSLFFYISSFLCEMELEKIMAGCMHTYPSIHLSLPLTSYVKIAHMLYYLVRIQVEKLVKLAHVLDSVVCVFKTGALIHTEHR